MLKLLTLPPPHTHTSANLKVYSGFVYSSYNSEQNEMETSYIIKTTGLSFENIFIISFSTN